MNLSTPGALCGLAAAGLVAWKLQGAQGTGVLIGYLSGSSLSMIGASWQRHALRFRPEKAFLFQVVAFLAKLLVLFLGTLSFRYIEAAAVRVDWRHFLISFVLAVLLLMILGTVDNARFLRDRRDSLKESQAL